MAILKEIKGNELYLWMNGNLIYKRWLETGQSKVFDVIAYDKYTYTSFNDLDYSKTPETIFVLAKLTMKKTKDGGRETGFLSGFRPNHIFEDEKNEILNTYVGEITFENYNSIMPGDEKIVSIEFFFHPPIEKHLNVGRKWRIHEGARMIGEAEIIKIKTPQ
jgi:hypothetical protein